MSDPLTTPRKAGLFEGLLRAASLLGGLVLVLITGLVSVSVFYRYVLGQPILGSQELIQIGMSVVVMLAMPFAAQTNKHIRVDIFDHSLGATGRFACDLLGRSASIFVLYLLVRKAWDKALDAHEFGDVTNMIEIPVWIAYGSVAIGMALYILVLALQILDQFRAGVADYE